jgi:acylphosphatase
MRMAFCVHGRVQGVGFRYYARDQGQRLGLAGWVRNDYDGSVTGEAVGEPLALEEFRRLLERGPGMAYVTRLDWSPLDEGQSAPPSFEIK